jgi:hypothetical protein
MTQTDFTLAMEQELQLRSVAFARADLLAFVADAWPLIDEDPDVTHWPRDFLASDRQPAVG